MSAKPAFSISDLQSGAKRLNTVDAPSESKNAEAKPVFDRAALEPLEDLYDKHNGDLDLIFAELNANPAKAKKPHHRPPNAKVFAEKYLAGYYSLVEEDSTSGESDAKGHK